MNTDPREIVQLCDRLQEVIGSEFSQLSPADVSFALKVLADEYTSSFVAICVAKGIIKKPNIG